MSLADYLAKNYLTADAPSKSSKKRKRKHQEASTGITIADDADTPSFLTADTNTEDDPTIVSSASGGTFRKAKTSAWRTVGAAAPSNNEQAAADAILADAETERRAREDADNAADAPTILNDNDDADTRAMANGARAGLQTAAQVGEALAARQRAERRRFKEEGAASTGAGAETIYRDASGRIINVAMKRAEARRAAEDEERKQQAEKEAMRGDAQRRDKEARQQALQDVRVKGVARYADDEDLNEELKARDRWNDPMAGLVSTKKSKKKGGKPIYQGAAEPNRYGIRPGYRWDGVDRGNGFEREYFASRNRAADRKELEYAWQMDE